MAIEIERKFLVVGEGWRTTAGVLMCQGYLNRDPARTVRVRLAGDAAYLTIKGAGVGIARAEFEYAIPRVDGEAMLTMCDGPILRKVRHEVWYAGMMWEVDEFQGDNAGLVVAELELETEDQSFECPAWLGAEVSGDARYFNSQLAVRPYKTW